MASEALAKRFYVTGTVQGVGFRFFVQRVAARLNVSGYVRNRLDGRVEIYALGSPAQIDTLRDELRRGPRMASVVGVDETDAEYMPEYANGFTIERDD